jgi:hypothetical protein
MSQKLYFRYLLGAIALFLIYHLFIWFAFSSKIFGLDDKHSVGDLGRMSYQIDMLYKRELQYTLPKSFIYDKTYHGQSVDVITIGDSFSHGGGGGTNPYYQDYIASIYDKKVLNINPDDPYDYFATIIGLHKSGFFKKSGAKILIIQSVERFFPRRFCSKLNFDDYNASKAHISKKTFSLQHLDVPLISTANYKIPYYYVMYKLKENAKKNIHKVLLKENLFTHNINNKMLFLHDDIANIPQFTQENLIKINDNFNKLAKLLSKDNLTLVVFPTPDKYDLYSSFIKNNTHPENPFFKEMQSIRKNYYFINSKKILLPLLDDNDIYYPDDTHWNYKASQALIKDKQFKEIFSP